MERHANYALVGMITTILVFVGLIFAVWLGGYGLGQASKAYRIQFQGPVRGLGKGGEVQFNGIKVGEVTRVRLAENDPRMILADIKVDAGTPVRTDSVASTESQGISGVTAVQISAGSTGQPLLAASTDVDLPIIRSKPGAQASLMDAGGQVVQKAAEAVDRVNKLLSDKTVRDLAGAVADLKVVTGELAANRAMVGDAARTISKLDAAAVDIEAAARTVRQLADGDGRRAASGAADAMDELRATLKETRAVVAGLSKQTGKVGTETIPRIAETLDGVRTASDSLNGLIEQIRQDPRGTLTRGSGKERKVKP